jgi:hypothetical protein
MLEPVNRLQRLLRTRAHGDILGEVHPLHDPTGVDIKLSRSRNVFVLGPGARMKHIVAPNYFRLGIGEKWIRESHLATMAAVYLNRIDANRRDMDATRFKISQTFLKTP